VYNNDKSQFFPCDNGVRQGVNMSSYLFAIFLNDLEKGTVYLFLFSLQKLKKGA
jgi:hypothetical protein